jgi:hypothetical protein
MNNPRQRNFTIDEDSQRHLNILSRVSGISESKLLCQMIASAYSQVPPATLAVFDGADLPARPSGRPHIKHYSNPG